MDIQKRCQLNDLVLIPYKININFINNKIDEINMKLNDGDIHYQKMDKECNIDPINYKLCVDNILNIISNTLKYELNKNQEFVLFSFDNEKTCQYTNYSYLSIFFGPYDNENFFQKRTSYSHIKKKVQTLIEKFGCKCSQKISVKWKNNKLEFELIYVPIQ